MNSHQDIPTLIHEACSEHPGWSRAAGRLMSIAENSSTETAHLLAALSNAAEPRIVLGITGAPGSGKSSLTNSLITAFRHQYPERRIGVIAIDPSSPFSGGALLGDRVRMMNHADDPLVFIRSSATRGNMGGITLGTLGVLRVMGLIGCDVVIIETVGVGQSEFEVIEIADMTAVVLAPGQGDTIQFLKAGLMEVGDLFIINKADSPDAESYCAEVTQALRYLASAKGSLETVQPFLVSARLNTGILQLLEHIEILSQRDQTNWLCKRRAKMHTRIKRVIFEEAHKQIEAAFEAIAYTDPIAHIITGQSTVAAVIDRLVKQLAGQIQ